MNPFRDFGRVLGRLFFPPSCLGCGEPLLGLEKLCPECRRRIDLTRPPYCLHCSRQGAPLDEETLLCQDCRGKCGPKSRNPLDRVLAGASYSGLLPNLVARFKYARARHLAVLLAEIMQEHPEFPVIVPHIAALVPVPMHWRKRLLRGYNQSADLARELGRQTGIPVIEALKRTRHDKAQAGLSKIQRRINLSGAFAVRPKGAKELAALLKQRPNHLVAIVDDVCTTGTTAELCARALKRAGAKNVILLCVAKTNGLAF